MWSLGSDVALMGSILLFVYRVLRNPTNPRGLRQLGELEGTIRSLIREAEGAGKGLNDQLIRRQEGLEKLLFDLEACEKRIHRIQSRAEETRGGVDVAMVKVQKALDALNAALARFQTRELQVRYLGERGVVSDDAAITRPADGAHSVCPSPVPQPPPRRPLPSQRDPLISSWYEAPEGVGRDEAEMADVSSYDGDTRAQQARSAEKSSQQELPNGVHAASSGVSEQSGGPIRELEERVDVASAARSIHERVTVDRMTQERHVTREHLAEARALLRQGLSVEEVSRRSGLLLDQVRLLSALDERSALPRTTPMNRPVVRPAIDPRLGVLGNIRR